MQIFTKIDYRVLPCPSMWHHLNQSDALAAIVEFIVTNVLVHKLRKPKKG